MSFFIETRFQGCLSCRRPKQATAAAAGRIRLEVAGYRDARSWIEAIRSFLYIDYDAQGLELGD